VWYVGVFFKPQKFTEEKHKEEYKGFYGGEFLVGLIIW